MGLHDADDDIGAFLESGSRRREHLVRLADAWGCTEEYLETATRPLLRGLQQRVR
jgi:hypothetical protein